MKLLSCLLMVFACLFSAEPSFAQKDYSKRLQKELVTIESGNYLMHDYQLLTFSNKNNLQLKVTGICPTEVMHRDNFISLFSSLSTVLMLTLFMEAGIEIPDMKELDELIGEPDITFNIIMAKNGVQVQTITSDSRENMTMTWKEIFEE